MADERIEELSDGELQKSYWYVTHISKLKKAGVLMFIALDSIIIALLLFIVAQFAFIEGSAYAKAIVQVKNSLGFVLRQGELPALSLGSIGAVEGNRSADGAETVDLFAKTINKNSDWWAEFDVIFTVDGSVLPAVKAFILPNSQYGDSRYVYSFSAPGTAQSQIAADIKNVSWHRIYGEEKKMLSERYNFSVQGVEFGSVQGASSMGEPAQPLPKAVVTVRNESAYGYSRVELSILIYKAGAPYAINSVLISDFLAGETRKIEARWFHELGFDSQMTYDIKPEVNVFDSKVTRSPL